MILSQASGRDARKTPRPAVLITASQVGFVAALNR
jgi:hypothetical protein